MGARIATPGTAHGAPVRRAIGPRKPPIGETVVAPMPAPAPFTAAPVLMALEANPRAAGIEAGPYAVPPRDARRRRVARREETPP